MTYMYPPLLTNSMVMRATMWNLPLCNFLQNTFYVQRLWEHRS
jgi:hypothetical protein